MDYHSRPVEEELPKVESCALWEYPAKSGIRYLSGIVVAGGRKYKIMLFKNKFKDEYDSRPLYQYSPKKK